MTTNTTPIKTTIGKLLLNSWSAEYALNIKPACADREFLNSALNWSQPQAYYAVLFSMRARLAVDEVNISDPEVLKKLMVEWAREGKFGPPTQGNPFAKLFTLTPPLMSDPDAALWHVELSTKVNAFAILSETYILHRWGASMYSQLIDELPIYMKDGFIGARATLLLSDD
jgi:hypothetical protein